MTPPLRIVSYNVRYFGHALRGLASTARAERRIAAALGAMDPLPDVVCLQEVETESIRSSVAHADRRAKKEQTQLEGFMANLEQVFAENRRSFPYEAYYFRAHAYRVRNLPIYTTGLAILVNVHSLLVDRSNVESPHHITHHHVERWRSRKQSRICAHVQLRDARGQPFHVFNTHLSLPTPFDKGFWDKREKMGWGVNQVQEARSLANFIARNAGDEPFLVCGDFNAAPGSPVCRYLVNEASLADAQVSLGQAQAHDPKGFPTAGFMHLRMHLDHLFGGNHLEWMDLEGTRPFGDLANPFHGLSDHVPLVARFRLP